MANEGLQGCLCGLFVYILLLQCTVQGLNVSTGDRLGANARVQSMQQSWQATTSAAIAWNNKWASKRKSQSCSVRKNGLLCGDSTTSSSAAAALLVATSPPVYDTRNPEHTGGFVLAPPPMDQGDCNTGVAYAVSAAARAASAAGLHRNCTDVPAISTRQLHYCAPSSHKSCYEGRSMQDVLQVLTNNKTADALVAAECLPMLSSTGMAALSDKDLCKANSNCQTGLPAGRFSYTKTVPLVQNWQIQDHIRQYGASVVTRAALPPGFREWFNATPSRRTAVYDNLEASNKMMQPSADGLDTNHAVVIAGYNNLESWWLIWSSWGAHWGDGGFAKVKYGQLSIGDPSFMYGIMFDPINPRSHVLPIQRAQDLPSGCVWYTVQPGDYISKVASQLAVPIEGLMQLNAQRLSSLSQWLEPGMRLQACAITSQMSPTFPNDTYAAEAFCASPKYKHTSCGYASDAEVQATTNEQCPACGRAYLGVVTNLLPINITTVPLNYFADQASLQIISLACRGRVVVRAVFKILYQPTVDLSQNKGLMGTNCSYVRMQYVEDQAITSGGDATAVVRCELQLPDGPGKEEERALHGKETKCYLCERCHDGKGCPANTGVWYSDSYTTWAQGCYFDQDGYRSHRVGFDIDSGTKALLAKFEVCNSPPCFNSSFEDEILKTAGRCHFGQCDP